MFKVRMQGQYGSPSDKRLSVVFREMWSEWGFRKGVMRGYWVGARFCRKPLTRTELDLLGDRRT